MTCLSLSNDLFELFYKLVTVFSWQLGVHWDYCSIPVTQGQAMERHVLEGIYPFPTVLCNMTYLEATVTYRAPIFTSLNASAFCERVSYSPLHYPHFVFHGGNNSPDYSQGTCLEVCKRLHSPAARASHISVTNVKPLVFYCARGFEATKTDK